jgi:hypothetical protein
MALAGASRKNFKFNEVLGLRESAMSVEAAAQTPTHAPLAGQSPINDPD